MSGVKILSLFDGMSCGHIAFDGLGIPIDRYVAYEIDKYAIKTATHNFPDIEECGDIFQGDFTQYRGFDWIIGGSVCTYWSIAQTKNRETTASGLGWKLFSQYARALHEAQPKFFLYENNKSMSQAIRESISETFGFEPVCINSALVSAQNRQRLYWVGRRNADGTYSQVPIEQPEDRGILLRDILETATDERCYALAEPVEARCVAQRGRYIGENGSVAQHFEAREDGKTNTITTVQKDNLVAIRIGTIENDAKNQDHDSQQYRVYSPDAKSVTLCGNGGGLGAKTGLYAVPTNPNAYGEFEGEGADRKKITIHEVRQGLITVKGKQWPIKLKDGYYIIRKLTVTECKRLQTVPDGYDFPTSDSQAYKMLGNAWSCEVIQHLIRSTYDFDAKEEIT